MDLLKFLLICGIFVGVSGTLVWETTWINNNRPFRNGSEIETAPSSAYLNAICPSSSGRLTLRCKTGNEAPFLIVKNDTSRFFEVTCVPHKGLSCKPYDGYNTSCPDFQINYGCDIPTTTLKVIRTTALTPQKQSQRSTINRSVRGGGWQPSTTTTKVSSTNKPTSSPMTSSTKPTTRPLPTSVKMGSSSGTTRKGLATGRTTKHLAHTKQTTNARLSSTATSSQSSTKRSTPFVSASVKSATSSSPTHAQTGQAISGKQCTCNNGRNASTCVVYSKWVSVAFLISLVWNKTMMA